MKWNVLGVGLALSLSLYACSSSKQGAKDGGANSCVQGFTACGGSLVGTWQIQLSCFDSNPSQACPAPWTQAYEQGYSITFRADGTFTLPSTSYTEINTEPASCFAGDGGASECAGLSLGACILASDGSCTCQGPDSNEELEGTYTVSGTSYTLTAPTTGAFTRSFCVQGNSLSDAANGTTRRYVKQNP